MTAGIVRDGSGFMLRPDVTLQSGWSADQGSGLPLIGGYLPFDIFRNAFERLNHFDTFSDSSIDLQTVTGGLQQFAFLVPPANTAVQAIIKSLTPATGIPLTAPVVNIIADNTSPAGTPAVSQTAQGIPLTANFAVSNSATVNDLAGTASMQNPDTSATSMIAGLSPDSNTTIPVTGIDPTPSITALKQLALDTSVLVSGGIDSSNLFQVDEERDKLMARLDSARNSRFDGLVEYDNALADAKNQLQILNKTISDVASGVTDTAQTSADRNGTIHDIVTAPLTGIIKTGQAVGAGVGDIVKSTVTPLIPLIILVIILVIIFVFVSKKK